MVATFTQYYDKQDTAAIATMFTKDAVQISSDISAANSGPQAIEEFFKNQFKSGFGHIDRVIEQVSPFGTDAAITVGKYQVSGQGQSGPIKASGSWTEVEVRDSGLWKIRLLTFAPTVAPASQISANSVHPDRKSVEADEVNSEDKKPIVQININKTKQQMAVFVDGVEAYQWPVSTGREGYSTPSGTYSATSMNEIWHSKEWDNAPMPHSIFFMKDGHAIHGSYDVKNLGRPVSHGCVRISPANAATLYRLVKENGLENTQVVLRGVTPGGEYNAGAASAGRHGHAVPNRHDIAAANRHAHGAYDAQPQTHFVPVERSSGARYYAVPQGYYAGSWPYARW
jgi:lipoprotein-anchoring transpeptidase ErfK/SrfK